MSEEHLNINWIRSKPKYTQMLRVVIGGMEWVAHQNLILGKNFKSQIHKLCPVCLVKNLVLHVLNNLLSQPY